MSSLFGIGGGGNVGASDSFYPVTIDDSLRFEDGSSAYLSRTPASAGDRRTWTWSGWVKRGSNILGTNQSLFSTATAYDDLRFSSNETILFYGGSGLFNIQTSAKYRDVSAWYHIVVAYDSTQATSTDRIKIYVNGQQETDFVASTYPSLNREVGFNNSIAHAIGRRQSLSDIYYDGYMADIHFIDGQALDPTSFGEFKDGVWIPSTYSGSYGDNGFHLEFDGAVTDSSGNGNDWTANNISAHDYVPDSPTNNFATWNSIWKYQSTESWGQTGTTSEGNLRWNGNTGNEVQSGIAATFQLPTTGKWYWECEATSEPSTSISWLGIIDEDTNVVKVASNTFTFATGDIINLAFDADNQRMYFGKDGTFGAGEDPTNPSDGTAATGTGYLPYCAGVKGTGGTEPKFTANFGQDSTFSGTTTAGGNQDANGVGDFKYAPPAGFLSLCSASLPTPTIIDGSEHFNTVLYTGTGATQSITGVGFGSAPDFVWIKQRSGAAFHNLYDRLRIVGGDHKRLYSNATNAEESSTYLGTTNLTSFDADGFSVGNGSDTNNSGSTYAAWNWKAGGTAVSNTDGSITSQVSANVAAGFSIASYSGTGSAASFGHGLGVQPSMVIVKRRDSTPSWQVFHTALGGGKSIELDNTSAAGSTTSVWNNTAPTSSVVNIGTHGGTNTSGGTYVAYSFANTEGYLKAGSYVGNNSTDGPMVFTGHKPAFVMIKCSSGAGTSWVMYDGERDTYNAVTRNLFANTSAAEATSYAIDFLSNGFKIRSLTSNLNDSGLTYIYLSFASSPLKFANAR
jgi:hypothetical protein